jgi:stage V sporulation protein R
MFKSHASRVRDYIADPSIGPKQVERILDAAHALRFQVRRQGEGKPVTKQEMSKETTDEIPDRLQQDLLGFE